MAQKHRFFHVDRARSLRPDQVLELEPNGLSPFGGARAEVLQFKPHNAMSASDLCEAVAEEVRVWSFPTRPSRLRCLFAFSTLDEAQRFSRTVRAAPADIHHIIEVFSSEFVTLDMNWLDYECAYEQRL